MMDSKVAEYHSTAPRLGYISWLFALIFSVVTGGCITELVRFIRENDFQVDMQGFVEREAAHIEKWTLHGRGMGAIAMSGRMDSSIQQTAEKEKADRHHQDYSLSQKLKMLAENVGANHAFIVNRSGLIVGDWDADDISPAGNNVGFRSYFRQAMQGVESVYAGISMSTGKRVFYVAAPVVNAGDNVSGVISARFDMSFLENILEREVNDWLLVSPQGVVFAASSEEWIMSLNPHTDAEKIAEINAGKQFGKTFSDPGKIKYLPFDIAQEKANISGESWFVARAYVEWNDRDGPWSLVILKSGSDGFSMKHRMMAFGGSSIFFLVMFAFWWRNHRNFIGRLAANRQMELSAASLAAQAHFKAGMSEMSARMQELNCEKDIVNILFSYLSALLPVQQGSVYGLEGENLHLLGHYGSASFPEWIAMHEGLLGQCAADGSPIIVKSPSDDFWKISSGLGEAQPDSLIILPLKLNGEISGVLEVASLGKELVQFEHWDAVLEILTRNLERVAQQQKVSLLLKLSNEESCKYQKLNIFQQQLIDAIPYPVFYKGADSRFLGFNKAYENVFNVTRNDLIGKKVLDLLYLPEADRVAYQSEDEHVIRTGCIVEREILMPLADGKIHKTRYYVAGLSSADGQPDGLVGTFIDLGIKE